MERKNVFSAVVPKAMTAVLVLCSVSPEVLARPGGFQHRGPVVLNLPTQRVTSQRVTTQRVVTQRVTPLQGDRQADLRTNFRTDRHDDRRDDRYRHASSHQNHRYHRDQQRRHDWDHFRGHRGYADIHYYHRDSRFYYRDPHHRFYDRYYINDPFRHTYYPGYVGVRGWHRPTVVRLAERILVLATPYRHHHRSALLYRQALAFRNQIILRQATREATFQLYIGLLNAYRGCRQDGIDSEQNEEFQGMFQAMSFPYDHAFDPERDSDL